MKTRKKFIVYCLLASLLVSNTFFSYTFADSEEENKCPACNSTPNEMQMYINFQVEMLWILRWVSAKKEVYWTNRNSWLFNGWALVLPYAFYKSTMGKLQNDFDSELKAVRAANTTAVLLEKMALAWLDDAMWSIQILFKDESFVRDYKLLQEIDMAINDIIRDMWTLGIWKDQVTSSVQQEILNLELKYAKFYWWNNPIFEKLVISQNVKNKEIASFLLLLNSNMKSMLFAMWEDTPVLDTYINYLERRYSKWNIVVKINEDYTKAIVDAYSCAKASTCNRGLSKALTDMVNWWEMGKKFGKSMEIIKKANTNLSEALSANNKSNKKNENKDSSQTKILTDRQVELLRTVYGINALSLTTSQQEMLKQNFEQGKKSIEPLTSAIKDAVTNISDEWKEYFSNLEEDKSKSTEDIDIKKTVTTRQFIKETIKVLITQPREPLTKWFMRLFGAGEQAQKALVNNLSPEERSERLNSVFWQETIPQTEKNEELIQTMQITVDKILVDKWKDKEYTMIWQNTDTHYFVEIWAYIHAMVEENIPKLIKDLWETCTYQCANKWSENCYAK